MENMSTPQQSGKLVVETKTTNFSDLMGKNSIEDIAANGGISSSNNENLDKPKAFITKKKMILFFVFVLLTIGFTFVTIFPILRIDWKTLNTSIGIGIARGWGWLWLIMMGVQVFVNLNRTLFTVIPRLKKWGYHIPYKDYLFFSITGCFISAVSPGAILSDPYCLFWLRTHGVPTHKSVSAFFSNSLLWQFSQIILTTPFFIVCCLFKYKLMVDAGGKTLFSFICIGYIIDFIGLIFFLLMNWSKNFHYYCSRLFNWFKKKLHMKYHTKEEVLNQYKEKAILRESFTEQMKDWKTTSKILIFWVVGDIFGLFGIVWCLCFVQNLLVERSGQFVIAHASFDIWWSLVCARLSVPANRLNFLPGQAMSAQATLVKLLNSFSSWKLNIPLTNDELEKIVNNSILTGSLFMAWIPAIIGIPTFIVLTKQQIKLSNEGKLFRK